jgi:hypothetical protein
MPVADEIADASPAISQRHSELADAPSPDAAAVNSDDASVAIQNQVNALRKSEVLQRDRAAQAATAPQPSLPQSLPDDREERIALWRQRGMTPQQADWLRENPRMIDRSDLTGMATGLADRDGYQPDDPLYFEVVKKHFNGLSEYEEQQHQLAAQRKPAQQSTPAFFEPAPSRPERSAIVSAPVSRDVPSSNREPRENASGRVTLSVAELEIARSAGLTPVEYARGKRELEQKKRDGFYTT